MNKSQKIFLGLLLLFLIPFLYVHFGHLHIAPMVDEPTWRGRTSSFVEALILLDFKNTYQSGHPGVMTMYTAGLGNVIYKSILYLVHPGSFDPIAFNEHNVVSYRLGMVLLNSFFILFIPYIIWKRLHKPVWALTTLVLLGFEPFIIRFVRFTHVDSIISFTLTIAVLYFLLYIVSRIKKDLVLSSAFFAMAVLTKLPSIMFVPYTIFTACLYSWKDRKTWAIHLLYLFGIAGSIYFIVWPVLWSNPLHAFQDFLTVIKVAVFQGHGGPGSTAAKVVAAPPKEYFFYLETMLYFLTPLLTGFYILSGLQTIYYWIKKGIQHVIYPLGLHIFVTMFIVMMTIGSKKGDRYLLPAVIGMTLLAGYAVQEIYSLVTTYLNKRIVVMSMSALYACMFVFYTAQAIHLHPYYFTYYNAWTPQLDKIIYARTGLGEGLELAAYYLNSKPQAKKLKVAAWYDSSFTLYFRGETYDPTIYQTHKNIKLDYMVIYGNMYGRDTEATASKIAQEFSSKKPEKTIYVNGFPYVWIYNID